MVSCVGFDELGAKGCHRRTCRDVEPQCVHFSWPHMRTADLQLAIETQRQAVVHRCVGCAASWASRRRRGCVVRAPLCPVSCAAVLSSYILSPQPLRAFFCQAAQALGKAWQPAAMSRVSAAVALGGLTLAPAFLAPTVPSTPGQKQLRVAEPASSRAAPSASACAAGVLGAAAVASLVAKKPVRAVTRQAFDASSQVGVTPPFGFFDPAGFTKDVEESEFNRLRACEIKHGRAAMMGALGLLVQSVYKLPGYESVPSGLAAQWTEPGANSLWIVFVAIGMLELGLSPWKEDPNSPGDYGDPLNLAKGNISDDIRNRELNNGRFAMFAWLGIVSAELYTGTSAVSQFAVAPKCEARTSSGFCGASVARGHGRNLTSRRAFDGASQPGASAPLGYFDPLGLSGTQERFDKFRASEVKHGRIAMLAIMGSFAAHWATPLNAGAGAAGFSDPIGAKGCVALTFFCGFLELGPWADGYSKAAGDFGDPCGFGLYFDNNDEMKTKELNNGRLAMMATIGMCTQEAVFGDKVTDLPAQLGL